MININMNEEDKVAVELVGTMPTLMSDLTHIVHGIMHGISDHFDGEDQKKGATETFKKLFLEGVVSGIFLETDAEQMKTMIKEANRLHDIHERLDKIQVGVMSLSDLIGALKCAVGDDDDGDDKPEEKPEETPIIDIEERLAKAINDFHHDDQPESPEEGENHEAE